VSLRRCRRQHARPWVPQQSRQPGQQGDRAQAARMVASSWAFLLAGWRVVL